MSTLWSVANSSLARVMVVAMALSLALYLDYMGAKPCLLCIIQRIFFAMIAVVAIVQYVFCYRSWVRWVSCLIMIAISLLGLSLALRHLWLIYYVTDLSTCLPSFDYLISQVHFGQLLHLVFTEASNCAQDRTAFLGILLPYWLLVFYGLNILIEVLMQRDFTTRVAEK
ncbi:MAG TPA: disulfide bond formation protein B [Gammaproteobacteria bacterium]|nr:disulfide bond formation protein B [Gammaproteobacteria bacterium]